jgi:CheY-like chemotaxis protein
MVLVALTAVTSQDAQARAREAGFDLHLAKPVDGGELTGLIERMLH